MKAERKTAWLIFIVLIYLFFRGIGDHGLLDPIEGTNASVALNMAVRKIFTVPIVDYRLYLGHNMGFWWLSALSLSVFGWSEFSVRLWSVIGGLGMAAAGWLIALRTCGERAANYAAVFIGSSLLVYITSQLASPHALYAFCVNMSLVGAVYAFRSDRFFILLHASAVLAFIVYGPAGVVLPWLCLLVYAVLAGQERFFVKALFYWPGLLITILIGGGYIAFLKVKNPFILTLMRHNTPNEVFSSTSSVFAFLVIGFLPWLGALPEAVKRALPLRLVLTSEKQNIFLLVWSAVFLFFGAFSGDALLLVASIPAMAVLCANYLAIAMENEDTRLFQRVAALEIALLAPFLFVGLPWFFAVCDKSLRHILLSVIPWAVFCLLFLLAGWYYARRRQVRKLMLYMSLISLFSLLPLAGVFDLLGENLSVKEAGLYIRKAIMPNDFLIQYALNRPSLSFYVGKASRASVLVHADVNQKMAGQNVVDDAYLDRIWREEKRAFMLINRHQKIVTPLPRIVYNLHEARDTIVLGNWNENELSVAPDSSS